MKCESTSVIVALIGLAAALPAPIPKNTIQAFSIPRAMLRRVVAREVPQELSHNRFLAGVRTALNLDNPAGIVDPVFGLLGDAAAAKGAGTITNLDCLHQATADQAFTNAKAAKDVTGMTDALLYAALERNTGKVGQKSVLCTDKAVNPEIQAIQAHQDPASDGAAATNKAIVLELAQQLQSIGADPQDALLSGTFAPGDVNDNTGAGNTCDTADDTEGCIFTQKLLVDDATAAEIVAAVAGTAAGAANTGAAAGGAAAGNATADACVVAAPAATKAAGAAKGKANGAAAKGDAAAGKAAKGDAAATAGKAANGDAAATAGKAASNAATGTNVQAFTGTLGGAAPPVVSSAGARPFSVNGATFVNAGAALQRSCAVQNNACANAVNSGGAGSVADCVAQEKACNAAA